MHYLQSGFMELFRLSMLGLISAYITKYIWVQVFSDQNNCDKYALATKKGNTDKLSHFAPSSRHFPCKKKPAIWVLSVYGTIGNYWIFIIWYSWVFYGKLSGITGIFMVLSVITGYFCLDLVILLGIFMVFFYLVLLGIIFELSGITKEWSAIIGNFWYYW